MATLKEWIDRCRDGEVVEAVVFGEMGWGDYGSERVPDYSNQPKGKVLTYDEALPWLTYEFDSGFGAPGCNAIYCWTATSVLFVSQYDGATEMCRIPRNPQDVMPEMPGGG